MYEQYRNERVRLMGSEFLFRDDDCDGCNARSAAVARRYTTLGGGERGCLKYNIIMHNECLTRAHFRNVLEIYYNNKIIYIYKYM